MLAFFVGYYIDDCVRSGKVSMQNEERRKELQELIQKYIVAITEYMRKVCNLDWSLPS